MQTAHPNVPNSEGDFETLFLYHVTENGQEDSPLVTYGMGAYEDDGILYAEFIIFDAPNTKPEHPVMLGNAQMKVTMADGTVYEMSFPEGDRGSSWSIFQIENGTFRVLDIVEEILAIHRE